MNKPFLLVNSSPDENGETTLDAMIMDGYEVKDSKFILTCAFHLYLEKQQMI